MVERGGGERPEESGRSSATEPVSVVIPAYDEEASVGRVARQVQQALREAATPHEVIEEVYHAILTMPGVDIAACSGLPEREKNLY